MAVRRTITPHEFARRSCGFTVTELARAIGVSHTYVSLVEGGKCRPSARYREAVAGVLNMPPEAIFGETASTPKTALLGARGAS